MQILVSNEGKHSPEMANGYQLSVQLWQISLPPSPKSAMNKEGFLAILSQIAQNLIKFKRFSFVKSHFTDPIIPFFTPAARYRR